MNSDYRSIRVTGFSKRVEAEIVPENGLKQHEM